MLFQNEFSSVQDDMNVLAHKKRSDSDIIHCKLNDIHALKTDTGCSSHVTERISDSSSKHANSYCRHTFHVETILISF